ncbi:MAG: metallophosphoesterase family protein, partial [Pyrinomonadaceae bacterium]
MKFLHIADVHLGCTRYQLATGPSDFYEAWIDVLQKYAVGESVDFVLMAGDFFHKRNVPPETMNHAFAGLSLLKDAGIPVVAIEGNHDQKHSDSDYSWLRSLADWDLLILLEPTIENKSVVYRPWDREMHRGGFVDIGAARIFGSDWYGASANWAMPMLAGSIRENRRGGAFHILMLHTDIDGYQTHPMPALSILALKELRSVTEYVALGHTHKSYSIDDWAFNPGSLEITSIDEYRETHGAYLIEVDEHMAVNAKHIEDYQQRPFQRLVYDVTGYDQPEEVTASILSQAGVEARNAESGEMQPIIEITLRGQIGFPNSRLEIAKIRDEVGKMTGALHVRIRNHAVPIEYLDDSDRGADLDRGELERRVVESLVIRDARYK